MSCAGVVEMTFDMMLISNKLYKQRTITIVLVSQSQPELIIWELNANSKYTTMIRINWLFSEN
jgi:hypothetical protein